MHVANCGDARALICDGAGLAHRLSYDHKAIDESERRRCEAMNALFLRDRLQGALLITRAVGDHDVKPFCIPDPYCSHTEIVDQPFFVLACDGVFDVLKDQDVVDIVKPFTDPKEVFFLIC